PITLAGYLLQVFVKCLPEPYVSKLFDNSHNHQSTP
ncbi:hypothetical protein AAKU64_002188, partial [Undibacterium sp. GrIS 1.8]